MFGPDDRHLGPRPPISSLAPPCPRCGHSGFVHADGGLHECLFAECNCSDTATNVVKLPVGGPPRREAERQPARAQTRRARREALPGTDRLELRHLTAIKGHAVLSVTLEEGIVEDRADYLRASGWAVEVM